MKLFSANVKDLRSLYITHLQKALDMEQKITKALPDLIESASDPDLRAAFRDHLEETRGHVQKIQQLLRTNTGESTAETCTVIDALTTEASDILKDAPASSIRDLALIGAAQQVAHHEMAVYGSLRRWAEILNLQDATVLRSIETDEVKTDQLLTSISKRANLEAAA